MHIGDKINGILKGHRDEREIQRWMFSLLPLGVAFAFFFIFMLHMEVDNKDVILLTGAAAGFSGVESYWVYRGWQREDGLTIILGLVGIVLTALFTWAYIEFLGEVLRPLFRSWAS